MTFHAKTCNHSSRDRPASGVGPERLRLHGWMPRCLAGLLRNASPAIAPASRVVTLLTICQKACRSNTPIRPPHVPRRCHGRRAGAARTCAGTLPCFPQRRPRIMRAARPSAGPARRGRGADVTQRCRGRSADARYWPNRSATASFSRSAVISPMCDSTRLPFASKKSVVGSPREP